MKMGKSCHSRYMICCLMLPNKWLKRRLLIVDHFSGELDKIILHLKVGKSINIKGNSSRKKVRTLFFQPTGEHAKFDVGALLENWRSLRALVLRNLEVEKIPDAIGKLLHLRLVDLSHNSKLVKLPKSFTKLHNLETLILRCCWKLRELPNDIDKLVKLRCLDILGCSKVLDIPESISKLRSLCWLPWFVVNMRNSLRRFEGLEGLRTLDQLKGSLHLKIVDEGGTNVKVEIGEGAVLINKQHLSQICLQFSKVSDYEEALLERLQPHQNLKSLEIWSYNGSRLPSWARGHKLGSSLSNLIIMKLFDCDNLKYLSGMGKLRHLRILELTKLWSLEYMEESRNRSQSEEEYLFFPSLKILKLKILPKLKGWWREDEQEDDPHSQPSPSFPHLSKLTIKECEELTLIPAFPSVENLILWKVNERLRITLGGINEKDGKGLGSKEVERLTCST